MLASSSIDDTVIPNVSLKSILCLEPITAPSFNIIGNSFSVQESFSSAKKAINLQNCNNGILMNTYRRFDNPLNLNGCTNIKTATLENATGTSNATTF